MITAAKLTVVLLLPIAVALLVFGARAVLPALMGTLAVAVVPYCSVKQALPLIFGLALTGTLATAAYGNVVAVVALVVVACLAAGVLGRISAGVFGMAPIVASVMSLQPPSMPPWEAGLIMLAAGLYVEIAVLLMKVHMAADPVPLKVALRHAVVMAVACGATAAVAVVYAWPHAYWLVMTLAIVLRPYMADSLQRNRQRIVGTVLGAVIALVLSPVPHQWQLLLAAVCMCLMLAYLIEKDYTLQVTFLTPMVIFLVSTGTMSDTLSIGELRVLYTASACIVGGLLAMLLARQQVDDEQKSSPA